MPGVSLYGVQSGMRHAVLAVVAALALASGLALAQEQAPNRRDLTIVAKDGAYHPNRLEVTQDDLVKITFSSEGRPATFAIDAYRIIKRAGSGLTTVFEFRADQAGTFTFYCNLTSDESCKDMKGTLVVKAK